MGRTVAPGERDVATLRDQKGEGRIGLLVSLVLLAVGVFVGVKIIPVRINAYEFGDFIEQECRYAAVRNQVVGDVTKRILDKAVELDIPLKKKDLVLQRTANEMIITASYELPIDLKVTVYNYKFYRREKAPIF